MTLPKRVCIVGGGAGGIISAKTLRERGFDVKVYDAESSLGGIWRYQEQPEQAAGIAPCYKSLRTNASREMMELSDFEFDAPTLFPRHEAVLSYLEKYARHFGVVGEHGGVVEFDRTVIKVEKKEGEKKWRVTTMKTVRDYEEQPEPHPDEEDTGSGFMYNASSNSLNSSFGSLSSLRERIDKAAARPLTPTRKPPLPPPGTSTPPRPGSPQTPPTATASPPSVPYYKTQRPSLSKIEVAPNAPDVMLMSENVDDDHDMGVTVLLKKKGEDEQDEVTEEFDFVVIATGAYRVPQIPQLAGLQDFKGTVLHSVEYRRPQPLFVKKRVLVIGLGSSAVDIALEAKNFAKEVYVSSKRGTWLVPRFLGNQPYDHLLTRANAMLPVFIKEIAFRRIATFLPKDHGNETELIRKSRITPDAGLAVSVQSGIVNIAGGVKRFSSHGVHFEDGTHFKCDVVVMCTGFQRTYDYLDESVLPADLRNRPPLYRHVFLPDVEGLAFVGACKVAGAVFPIIEMQARWVSHVFAGDVSLPPPEKMRAHVDAVRKKREKRGADPLFVQDRLQYLDSIAEYIGAKPNLWDFRRERLALLPTLLFGPAEAWAYRLDGPGSFKEMICRQCGNAPQSDFSSSSGSMPQTRVCDSIPEDGTLERKRADSSTSDRFVICDGVPVQTTGAAPPVTADRSDSTFGFSFGSSTSVAQQAFAPDTRESSYMSLDLYDGHTLDEAYSLRRRRTLPGCDHLHRRDANGREMLFFMARTDFYNAKVKSVARQVAVRALIAFLVFKARRRIWYVCRFAMRLYFIDFLQLER